MLAVCETVSQGLIAAKCAGFPWLLEAVYADNVARLCSKLGADYREEAVAETAARLAQALRISSGADLALLQLYAGGPGALHDKDQSIGLYHALADANGVRQGVVSTGGPLQRKQNQAALLALDFLRRCLQKV